MKDVKQLASAFWAMRSWFDKVCDFYSMDFSDCYCQSMDRFSVAYSGHAESGGEIQKMLAEVLPYALKGYQWTLEAMTITVAGYTILVSFDKKERQLTFTCELTDYKDIGVFWEVVSNA